MIFAIAKLTCNSLSQTNFEIKTGLNFTKFADIICNSMSVKTGFNVGVFSQLNLNKKFIFQPDLLFPEKGCDFKDYAENTQNQNLIYASLPFMFVYQLPNIFIEIIGPEISNLLNSKGSQNDTFDYGIDLELSCKIYKYFGAEFRWNYGLKDLKEITLTDLLVNITGRGTVANSRLLQISRYYIFKTQL